MSPAFTINTISLNVLAEREVTVTNGTERVSLVIKDVYFNEAKHATLSAEDAIRLAVALLNGAHQVQEHIHGNSDLSDFTNIQTAITTIQKA